MHKRLGFHPRHVATPRLRIAVALLVALLSALGLLRWTASETLTSAGLIEQGLIKQVGGTTTFKSIGTSVATTPAPTGLATGDVVVSYLETPSNSRINCSSPSSKILDQRHDSTRLVACLSVIGTTVPTAIRAIVTPSDQVTMVTLAFSGVDLSRPVDSVTGSASRTSPHVVTSAANDDVVYGEGSSGHLAAARPFSGATLAATINDASTSQAAVATSVVSAQGVTAPVGWTITPTSRQPAAAAVALRAAPAAASTPSPSASSTDTTGPPSATPTPTPTSSATSPPSPTPTSPTAAPAPGGAPTAPPVTWCENGLPASPYTSAPDGSVTVPAGDDSSFDNSNPNTTYWFAPGTHTNLSIQTADGDTYIGAPGAIINGGNNIQYAFQGQYNDTADQNVTIKYLTIEDFDPNQGGGAVNGNGNVSNR